MVLPFTVCHWLLIGPKYEACGFDYMTGRPRKATAAKCSHGKGPLGSMCETSYSILLVHELILGFGLNWAFYM